MVVQMLFTLNNHFFVQLRLKDYFCLTNLTTFAGCFF